MFKMKKSLIVCAIILPVFALAYSLVFYDLFSSCPLKFRFEYETACWMRDERDGVKLIELFNASQDTIWLAKVRGDKITWFQHPINRVEKYNHHIPENELKFVDESLDIILVNGISYRPEVLSQRPPPGSNEIKK